MKKFWKWFLGILLVLVIVAGVVLAAFFLRHGFIGGYEARGFGRLPDWDMPMMNGRGFHQPGGRGFYPMGGHGFFPLGGGLMFLGIGLAWLLPLALFGLLVYGIYAIGKQAGSHAMSSPAPVSVPTAAHPCPKCGASVQDDWKHCPQCGKKQ